MLKRIVNHSIAGDIANLLVGRVGAMASGLLALTVATRLSDREDFGLYTYGISIVNLCLIFGLLGFRRLMVREVAKKSLNADVTDATSIGLRIALQALAFVGIASVCVYVLLPFIANTHELESSARLSLLLVVPFGLLRLGDAFLRGKKRFRISPIPDQILRPALFGCFLLVVFFLNVSFTERTLILCQFAASLISLFLLAVMLFKIGHNTIHFKKDESTKTIVSDGFTLGFVSLTAAVFGQLPTLSLGFMATADAVGLYAAPARVALMVGLLFSVVNQALAPSIVQIWEKGSTQEMEKIATSTSAISLLISIVIAMPIFFFPEYILTLILGDKFTDGKVILIIITCAQLVNVASGSVTSWLAMTGNQLYATLANLTTVVVTLIAAYLIIPSLKAEGAAIVYAVGILLSNTLQAIAVRIKLGFNPTAFGVVKHLGKTKSIPTK